MKNLIYGVGINDIKGSRNTPEYDLWLSVLFRCYSSGFQSRSKTYHGCHVSDNFKKFSYFQAWCRDQIGFGVDGFELDKDLLVKGNKIYSEEYCVFLPREINILLAKRTASRGIHPIGVSFDKSRSKFEAYISINGRKRSLGRHETSVDAFNAYKTAKEKHVKDIAKKHRGVIDQRAYEALYRYIVEITD